MIDTNILYYGRKETLPQVFPLQAGPLALFFENGDLRYIRLGDLEIFRRVYVALRDRNWCTIPPRLFNLRVQSENDRFRISFEVENRHREIDFLWRGSIKGSENGEINFLMDGQARSTFLRNRIGLCLLHPVQECASKPCRVERVDGTIVEGVFPRYISPHQPFKDIRAISHLVAEDLFAEVRFAGEVFEMEDQRNWTDASFKTYSTPLALPFPVEIREGTRIVQSLSISLKSGGEHRCGEGRIDSGGQSGRGGRRTSGGAQVSRSKESICGETKRTVLTVGAPAGGRLPRIGLEMSESDYSNELSDRETGLLKRLHLSHLRAEIRLRFPDWQSHLIKVGQASKALGTELELVLFLSGNPKDDAERELKAMRRFLDSIELQVCTWLIHPAAENSAHEDWIASARNVLQSYRPEAMFGSGTDAFFNELNQKHSWPEEADLLYYSVNPQVHAFDNRSLVENLEAQAFTVDSARRFSGGRPIAVSPVTLRPRYNPYATGPEPECGASELPPQVDLRQMSLFGAAWTLGSLKYLGQSGVYSVTYFQTTGWRGVMEAASGAEKHALFPSIPGSVFPLYHILADVGEWREAELLPTKSNRPLQIEGLALQRGDKKRIILGNLGNRVQTVTIFGIDGPAELRFLDQHSAQQAMTDVEHYRNAPRKKARGSRSELTVEILPYAVLCIDTV